MSTSDTPGQPEAASPAPAPPQTQVIMVPVKRYDVVLSLDDLLTPLTQTATNLSQTGMVRAAADDPEMNDHLQRFNDLVGQLKDVVSKINAINPDLLASRPTPPPSAG